MDNIVTDWLRMINLGQYSEGFIDNGYDDLETVKLIHLEDLEAIGWRRLDLCQREVILTELTHHKLTVKVSIVFAFSKAPNTFHAFYSSKFLF